MSAVEPAARVDQELPYASEYAKSGRATCKACRNTIAQDSLRMSAREPSRFFDGLQDNWFHYDCFWRRLKKADINERSIRGVENLQWHDQEKIRDRIATVTGVPRAVLVVKAEGQDDTLLGGDTYAKCRIEYAKSSRGRCAGCKELIDQGVMKVARGRTGGQFFHMECFFGESRLKGSPSELMGFDQLTAEDQQTLAANLGPSGAAPRAEKRVGGGGEESAGTPRKLSRYEEMQLVKQQNFDEFKKQNEFAYAMRLNLQTNFKKAVWVELLEANYQTVPKGDDKILDRLVDCLMFGCPTPCKHCVGGQIVYSSSHKAYVCTGHISEWTSCTFADRNPMRTPFGIPRAILDKNPQLKELETNSFPRRAYNCQVDGEKVVGHASSFRHLGAKTAEALDDSFGDKSRAGSKFGGGVSGKSMALVKQGTVVDGECEHAEYSHVVRDENGALYSCALTCADMANNKNSYYKIQLLRHDNKEVYYLFRSWGRVGTTVGGTKSETFHHRGMAVTAYEDLFREKTRNEWADRAYFRKRAGGFTLVDTDYSEVVKMQEKEVVVQPSRLPPQIQEIIKMIFDVENMKSALKGFEIDMEKMPLGKLSKKQMLKAYTVLQEIKELLPNKTLEMTADRLLDCYNRFYNLIPHNFGMRKAEPIDTEKKVDEKAEMLESLMEIEFAYGVVQEAAGHLNGRDPVDVHYDALKTKMEVVPRTSDEFHRLSSYLKNTQGKTHTQFSLDIVDIIRIERAGEAGKFKKHIGNRQLLWHGSGTTNYSGILSQGLRIAPPEAIVTGYMFGKGVYFADMVSKSAGYCRIHTFGDDGLLLLSEVALGKVQEEIQAFRNVNGKVNKGFDSVKGCGGMVPNPSEDFHHPDGYKIPMGRPLDLPPREDNQHRALLYNEYIVYNVDQIQLRYLVRCKFNQYRPR